MITFKSFLLFLFLGMLVSFGPFITDMCLVALPDMMKFFQVDMPSIQLTLTFSMLGLATGQIIFGYVGDKYGRKTPLIVSLSLFSFSTLFCAISDNINILLLNRFIQGFSSAGCIVLARSMIPDLFQQDLLVKAISVTTVVYTTNRIVSPLISGFAFQLNGWKGIFFYLMIVGIILLISSFFIPETNKRKSDDSSITLKESFKSLLNNKPYLYFTGAFTFILTLQFAYVGSCSFIFQKHYSLSPLWFSSVLAFNSAVFGVGAFLPSQIHMTAKTIKNLCLCLSGICATTMLLPVINGNMYLYEVLMACILLIIGICFTLFMAKALDVCRKTAGLGAALLGTFYFLFGSLVTPLVGYGNIFYTSGIIMSIFAILTYYCVYKAYLYLDATEQNN